VVTASGTAMKMQKRSRGLGIGTSATEPQAESVRFHAGSMWVSLGDGRQVGAPLAYFPRLLHATAKQRGQYVISGRRNRSALGRD
jgi:hypothetical protein